MTKLLDYRCLFGILFSSMTRKSSGISWQLSSQFILMPDKDIVLSSVEALVNAINRINRA
jgi:hypothetical protein